MVSSRGRSPFTFIVRTAIWGAPLATMLGMLGLGGLGQFFDVPRVPTLLILTSIFGLIIGCAAMSFHLRRKLAAGPRERRYYRLRRHSIARLIVFILIGGLGLGSGFGYLMSLMFDWFDWRWGILIGGLLIAKKSIRHDAWSFLRYRRQFLNEIRTLDQAEMGGGNHDNIG